MSYRYMTKKSPAAAEIDELLKQAQTDAVDDAVLCAAWDELPEDLRRRQDRLARSRRDEAAGSRGAAWRRRTAASRGGRSPTATRRDQASWSAPGPIVETPAIRPTNFTEPELSIMHQ